MRWRAPGLAVLVFLAGCSGLAVDGGSETVTPAPVPEITTTQPTPPPGIAGARVDDVDALARAHVRSITGRSYVWRVQFSYDGRESQTVLRVKSARTYHLHQTSLTTEENVTEYADGQYRYVRFDRFGPRFVRGEAVPVSDRFGPMQTRPIRRFLSGENLTVAKTRVDGQRRYVVRGGSEPDVELDDVENYSVTARVTPGGFVRSLNASYVRVRGSDRDAVTYRFTYETPDTVTVERPVWVGRRWTPDGDVAP